MSQLEVWRAMWREAAPKPMLRVALAACWDGAVDQLELEGQPTPLDQELVADRAIQLWGDAGE